MGPEPRLQGMKVEDVFYELCLAVVFFKFFGGLVCVPSHLQLPPDRNRFPPGGGLAWSPLASRGGTKRQRVGS